MKKVRLEVNVKDKTLSANGKKMKLDDSLYQARDYNCNDNMPAGEYSGPAIDLRYRPNDPEDIETEAGEIGYFLKQQGMRRFTVSGGCYEDYALVSIVGNIDPKVYD